MDSPVATIISISNGTAIVAVSRTVACARCAAGKGCGAGLFSGKSKPVNLEVPVPETLKLQVGDKVNLELSPDSLLRASFLVYGLPLIGVISALILGRLFAGPLSDGYAVGLAIVGLVTGLIAGRARIGRNRCLEQFVPKISARAPLTSP